MFYMNIVPHDEGSVEFKVRYAFNAEMGRVLAFSGYTPANRQWLNEFFTEEELNQCRRESVAVGLTERGQRLLAEAVEEMRNRN